VDSLVRTNDATILTYDTELYFMQAVADLMTMDYKKAEKDFKFVLDEFGDSRQKDSSTYWYGMSILFQQRYSEALPVFEKYIKEFPEGKWLPNAYFQKALCVFGMEKYDEAKKGFTYVIEHFPNSSVYPDACSMRGDLYGADSLLDEALADYQRAIKSAKKVKQATYAVFKSAEIFEADETIKNNNNKIIEIVQQYLDTWGDQADIAKALFWIGKTRIQQGYLDEAVQTYIDAIVKYGSNLQQDGVDLMIAELVKISTIWLGVEKQEQLLESLQTAMDLSDNPTVKLRLRVAIAMLTHTEVELGKQLIKELPSLDDAPPPVLSIICDASFDMKDYSRAEEILKIFQSKFEDSKYTRDAYKLRAYGQFAQKDYTNALETIRETQETYGTEPDVAWAQLMKAQIYLEMGNTEDARKANLAILGEPNWRGDPFAQATYQLGQVAEKEGDPLKAFGFYQRTYFQFKGYANGYWAAEAYLASARCLQKLDRPNDVRNTYRAMLYDNFVNDMPQAKVARKFLDPAEVVEIQRYLKDGGQTNITVLVETKEAAPAVSESETESQEAQNEASTAEEPTPENQTQTEGE
jgi:TolA-binding protein